MNARRPASLHEVRLHMERYEVDLQQRLRRARQRAQARAGQRAAPAVGNADALLDEQWRALVTYFVPWTDIRYLAATLCYASALLALRGAKLTASRCIRYVRRVREQWR